MFIVKLILKIVFSPIYVPYVILKWLGSGNSSSSSASGTSSSAALSSKGGVPLVTIDKSLASKFELGQVRAMNARQIQVAYKEKGASSFTKILIDRPKNQSGPIRVDWSKTIS